MGNQPNAPKSASADLLSEMDVSTLFDFLAVKIDSFKVEQMGRIRLNVITPGESNVLLCITE